MSEADNLSGKGAGSAVMRLPAISRKKKKEGKAPSLLTARKGDNWVFPLTRREREISGHRRRLKRAGRGGKSLLYPVIRCSGEKKGCAPTATGKEPEEKSVSPASFFNAEKGRKRICRRRSRGGEQKKRFSGFLIPSARI